MEEAMGRRRESYLVLIQGAFTLRKTLRGLKYKKRESYHCKTMSRSEWEGLCAGEIMQVGDRQVSLK